MKLNPDSIKWVIEFIERHSDGDIFPHTPETSVFCNQPKGLIDALSKYQLNEFQPQPFRRFWVPKSHLSYRQATQLHPQDSMILTAIVFEHGEGIENRRLPEDRVFSYRFNPSQEKGLYGGEGLWNKFWSSAAEQSRSYSCIIYCDIADFYNQISHHVVENQLAESQFPDQSVKWILNLLKATTQRISRSIPIGPHAAHLIAECTLIPIDDSLNDSGIEFIRYADDLVIFCDSESEAGKALHTVTSTLDEQQQLMLQERKTNIFYDGDEFRQYCDDMIEDRPINKEEDKILKIIRKYSSGNPYARITYNQVKPSDWKAFSENIVSKIIKEYLGQDEVDYARLRWFFRRLAQVGHSGGLQVVVDNINRLEPCLPSICSYISSIQEVPAEKWEGIGEQLVSLLETESSLKNEFARLSILSLFSKNEHMNHFVSLAQQFNLADGHTRREILLAARTNGAASWLRQHKKSYSSMDPWQRMAFLYCVSILPKEERRFFLKYQSTTCPFEQELKELSLQGS